MAHNNKKLLLIVTILAIVIVVAVAQLSLADKVERQQDEFTLKSPISSLIQFHSSGRQSSLIKHGSQRRDLGLIAIKAILLGPLIGLTIKAALVRGLIWALVAYGLHLFFPAVLGFLGLGSGLVGFARQIRPDYTQMLATYFLNLIQTLPGQYHHIIAPIIESIRSIPEGHCRYRAVCEIASHMIRNVRSMSSSLQRISATVYMNFGTDYSRAWLDGIVQNDCAVKYAQCTTSPFSHVAARLAQSLSMKQAKAALLLLLILPVAHLSAQQSDVTRSTLSQQLSVNNQEEIINVGNSLTNNFHTIQHNYQPTQSTQLVFNVGKLKTLEDEARKLRKSRPPTLEEMALKRRIMEIYERAALEGQQLGDNTRASANLQHLGRILRALNPKYIATERLWLATFNNDPVEPPELEASTTSISSAPAAAAPLQLEPELPIGEQLDELATRFSSIVSWDQQFAKQLFAKRNREQLEATPTRKAFTRLLKCLSFPLSCNRPLAPQVKPNPPPRAQPVEETLNQHAHQVFQGAWSAAFPTNGAYDNYGEQQQQQQQAPVVYETSNFKSPSVDVPALTQRLMQIYGAPNYNTNEPPTRPVIRPRPFSDVGQILV